MKWCIVTLLWIASGYAQHIPKICSIHPDQDKIQDYSDCSKYIICSNGNPTSYTCEDGSRFDPVLRVCSQEFNDCFQCPSEEPFIDLPVDYACSQYVRCFNGIATHRSCESGSLFDPIRGQCNKKEAVVCPCPTVDFPGFPYFVRDWLDCHKYNVCWNGTVILSESCPSGLYFSLTYRQCIITKPTCFTETANSVFVEMKNQ